MDTSQYKNCFTVHKRGHDICYSIIAHINHHHLDTRISQYMYEIV